MYNPHSGYSHSVLSSLGLLPSHQHANTSNKQAQLANTSSPLLTPTSPSQPVFVVSPVAGVAPSVFSPVGSVAPSSSAAAGATHDLPPGISFNNQNIMAHPLNATVFLLFVVGPPSSGKSTMCKLMVSELGFQHIDVDQLLVEEIKKGSNTGHIINDFMSLNQDVPGELVADLLYATIGSECSGASSLSGSSSSSSAASSSSHTNSNVHTFFCIEHFPNSLVAWNCWLKKLQYGIHCLGPSVVPLGSGLVSALELELNHASQFERELAKLTHIQQEEAQQNQHIHKQIESKLHHYSSVVDPLVRSLSELSLIIPYRVSAHPSIAIVWNQVKSHLVNYILNITFIPPFQADLSKLSDKKSTQRLVPPSSLTTHVHSTLFGVTSLIEYPDYYERYPQRITKILPILLLGGPGSGRTTLAKHLCQEFHMAHIHYDELLIAAASPFQEENNQSERAAQHESRRQRIVSMLEQSDLIDASLAIELVVDAITHVLSTSSQTMFVIDGLPMTPDYWLEYQRGILGHTLTNMQQTLTLNNVIGFYLDASERIRHSRLLRRRSNKDASKTIEHRMRFYENHIVNTEATIMNEVGSQTIFRLAAGLSEGEIFREATKRLVSNIMCAIDIDGSNLLQPPLVHQGNSIVPKNKSTLPPPQAQVYRLGSSTTASQFARVMFALGSPGSGCSSLCQSIVNDYEMIHLNMEYLIQQAISTRSAHRAAIIAHQQASQNQPDVYPSYICIDLLKDAIQLHMKANNSFFLISGFPQSLAHMESFDKHMVQTGLVQVLKSFFLDCNALLPLQKSADGSDTIQPSLATLANAPDEAGELLCQERLIQRGDSFNQVNIRIKTFNLYTRPFLLTLFQPLKLALLKSSNSASGPSVPPVLLFGAPVITLPAGNSISKQTLYQHVQTKHLTELSYLYIPESNRKQVNRTVVFVLFVMGGNGSGRSSIIDKLLRDYNFVLIDVDVLLQQEVESGSEDGLIIQSIFESGGSLPSELVAQCIKRFMNVQVKENHSHFLLSGYPLQELDWWSYRDVMGSAADIPTALFLDCPAAIRMERLLAKGEHETLIRQSIDFFETKTMPLIDYLATHGTVLSVSSMEPVDIVYSNVQRELEILLSSLRSATAITAPGSQLAAHPDVENIRKGTHFSADQVLQAQVLDKYPQLKPQQEPDTASKVYILGQSSQLLPASSTVLPVSDNDAFNHRFNLLFFVGAPGSGCKTHLTRIHSLYANVYCIDVEKLAWDEMNSGSTLGAAIHAHLKAHAQQFATMANQDARQYTSFLTHIQKPTQMHTSILPHVSAVLLAQVLHQHLQQLYVHKEEELYDEQLKSQQHPNSSSFLESLPPFFQLNCIIYGFPGDERSYQEFLDLMSSTPLTSSFHTSFLLLDAPESIRIERLKKQAMTTFADIEQHCQYYNSHVAPFVNSVANNSYSRSSSIHPSSPLYTVSAIPSIDVTFLQIQNCLDIKFGVFSANKFQSGAIWHHPFGLKQSSHSSSLSSSPSSAPRTIFALFILGGVGSGRTTLCQRLAAPGSEAQREWNFISIDLKELMEQELQERPQSNESLDILEWQEQAKHLAMKPVEQLTLADSLIYFPPPLLSIRLLSAALSFHTKLCHFYFLITNFVNTASIWKEWEQITNFTLRPTGIYLDCPEKDRLDRLRTMLGEEEEENINKAEFFYHTSTFPVEMQLRQLGNIHSISTAYNDPASVERESVAFITRTLATLKHPNPTPSMPSLLQAIKQASSDQSSTHVHRSRFIPQAVFVVGAPGSGRKEICQQIVETNFSYSQHAASTTDVPVHFHHIDVDQLYRAYLTSHPASRLAEGLSTNPSNDSMSQSSTANPPNIQQARNLQLTMYLLRQEIERVVPKHYTSHELAGHVTSHELLDEVEDESTIDAHPDAGTHLPPTNTTTLLVISGFPRDIGEWKAWNEQIEAVNDYNSSLPLTTPTPSTGIAELILVIHLDVDLSTASNRLLSRGDKADTVKQNLATYTYRTAPVLDVIRSAKPQRFISVQAHTSIVDVWDDLKRQMLKHKYTIQAIDAEKARKESEKQQNTSSNVVKIRAANTLGMVGSNTSKYTIGENSSTMVEIQSLLSQLPQLGNHADKCLARLVYILAPPGAGANTIARRLSQHYPIVHINMESLVQAEVESGSVRGVMIMNAREEKKAVSKYVLIAILLQQLVQITTKHHAAQSSASSSIHSGPNTNTVYVPASDDEFQLQLSPPPLTILLSGFPATSGENDAFERVLTRDGSVPSPFPLVARLYFDCAPAASIQRLLRAGRSAVYVDHRMSVFNARSQAYFASFKPNIHVLNPSSNVPPYASEAAVQTLNHPQHPTFQIDAAMKEEQVYQCAVRFLESYLQLSALAASSPFTDSSYVVGAPLDPRPIPHFLFVVGAPGAGVQTLVDRLLKVFDFTHIDLNQLAFNESVKTGARASPDTLTVQSCLANGEFLPPDVALRLMFNYFNTQQYLGKSQFLVTHFPCSRAHWASFQAHVESKRIIVEKIIFLDCPEAERIERLKSRGEPLPKVDALIQQYNMHTKPIMSDLLARNMLERISSRVSPEHLYTAFVSAYMDPKYNFLRFLREEEAKSIDRGVHARTASTSGPVQTIAHATVLNVEPVTINKGEGEDTTYQLTLKPRPPTQPKPQAQSSNDEKPNTQINNKLKQKHTMFVVFIMGGAGSGRRTVCNRLVSLHSDYAHIDVRALEQAEIALNTEAGKSIQQARQYGRIPNHTISIMLIHRAIKQAAIDSKRLALVNGFPEDLDGWKTWGSTFGLSLPTVIYLTVPENVREARLINQALPLHVVKSSSHLFNTYTRPLLESLMSSSTHTSVLKVSALPHPDQVFQVVEQQILQVMSAVNTQQEDKKEVEEKVNIPKQAANTNVSKKVLSPDQLLQRSKLEGEYLHLSIVGENLDKPDFFSSANPYLEFYRFLPASSSFPSGRWEKIYQSVVCFNTCNPVWNSFIVDNDSLCARDTLAVFLIVIWSWTKNGTPKFIASVKTCLKQLMELEIGYIRQENDEKKLLLTKAIQLTTQGDVTSTSTQSKAGALKIIVCRRLIYRPFEEIQSSFARPPSASPRGASTDSNALSPIINDSLNNVQVPIPGSVVTYSPISTTTLLQSAERSYDYSECCVRLCMTCQQLQRVGVLSSQLPVGGSVSAPRGPLLANQMAGTLSAGSIRKNNTASPYIDIYCLDRDVSTRKPYWKHLYTSEVVENSYSPKFNIIVLKVWDVCANDYFRPILIKVWDHSTQGAPEFIGELQTNLKDILTKSASQTRFPLVTPNQARTLNSAAGAQGSVSNQFGVWSGNNNYDQAGTLVFTYARVFSDIKFSSIQRNVVPDSPQQLTASSQL